VSGTLRGGKGNEASTTHAGGGQEKGNPAFPKEWVGGEKQQH